MTTVEVRSYSRNSGRIWWEMESGRCNCFRHSATVVSFFGFANEKRKETAMDWGFADAIVVEREFSSSVEGDDRVSPSLAVRSLTPNRRCAGTSGSILSKKKS